MPPKRSPAKRPVMNIMDMPYVPRKRSNYITQNDIDLYEFEKMLKALTTKPRSVASRQPKRRPPPRQTRVVPGRGPVTRSMSRKTAPASGGVRKSTRSRKVPDTFREYLRRIRRKA